MAKVWKELCTPETIDIVAPDGTVRCTVVGYYSGNQFFIDDMTVDVRSGDEIRRLLPNGRQETFIVQDPKYYADEHFGSHYQVKIGRANIFPRHTGGHYNIHVSGSNSRVNVSSTDQSVNTVNDGDIFNQIRKAFDNEIQNELDRVHFKTLLSEIEAAKDKKSFINSYQALIASASNHMTIIAPFLPELTKLLNNFTF